MAGRTTMNISVPPQLRDWIKRRVREGGFGTSSEFVRHVLREAWLLEKELLAGLNSGPATPMTKRDWARLRGSLVMKRRAPGKIAEHAAFKSRRTSLARRARGTRT